ncbi:hypothetical protein RD792_010337 [Penstemon davidsonii]|uniref:C2H2-type domain-containing protein n=1 Tax=Penstemon davidsonii TaxID=160366 RepID=A0ABR0D1K9_9LAMI|nr:hypothetical protein RD792_010337 [Penstemon davidsonii]
MISDDGISSIPSSIRGFTQDLVSDTNPTQNPNSNPSKRKRNLPGNPDPDAEVIALSPKSLMATNRFICEICNKGFQRDQNLQLHRRGHNLPWKLKQRNKLEVVRKKVYICPEKTCVHHDPSRALGDLTGIKKHFSRKHGEKKWKCEKCSKKYAVQSDWKAHSKICGTREYKCDCGTLFSRKDSFITHRAFCDALADESATRFNHQLPPPNLNFRNHELMNGGLNNLQNTQFSTMFRPEMGGLESSSHQLNLDLQKPSRLPMWLDNLNGNNNIPSSSNANNFMGSSSSTTLPELVQMASQNNQWFNRGQQEISAFAGTNNSINNNNNNNNALMMTRGTMLKEEEENKGNNLSAEAMMSALYYNNNQQETNSPPAPMSATALLQKAAQMGSTRSNNNNNSTIFGTHGFGLMSSSFSSLGNFNTMKSTGTSSSTEQQQQQVGNNQNMNGGGGGGVLMALTTSNNLQQQQQGDNGNLFSSRRMDQQSENGLTRDFLGVGGNNNENRRFLQENEMVKFASMDMGHYSSRN